jgi:hypothetical protein
MRHIEFLDAEIEEVERLISKQALSSPDARHLLTVPGVNVICAATFLATIGDIRRFKTSRQLVGYLGLDSKVRQSGSAPAKSGRISKQGSPQARWALVEAAWSVVQQPGPMRAFYQRIRARRGFGVAIVATARKLATLFWCLLTRGETYAHQQPSLTAKKLRRLELKAGAEKYSQAAAGVWSTNQKPGVRAPARPAGRGLLPADGPRLAVIRAQAKAARGSGRERDTGARIIKALEGQSRAAGPRAPDACTSTRHRLAPTHNLTRSTDLDHPDGDPACANTGHNHADRGSHRPNRPHRSRSAALGDSTATDRSPENSPKSSSRALDFHPSSKPGAREAASRALAWCI